MTSSFSSLAQRPHGGLSCAPLGAWPLLVVLLAALPAHAFETQGGLRGRIASSARGLWSRDTLLWLSAGACLAVASTAVEDPDAEARTLDRWSIDPVLDAGNVYGSNQFMGPAALVLMGAGYATGSSRVTEFGWDVAASVGYAQLMTGTLKVAVDRTRPNGDRYSFPSGHAASAFAVASVAHAHWGAKVGAIMYVAAAGVAAGRLEDNFHYLSDVIFGAAVGVASGRGVVRGRGEGARVQVAPSSLSIVFPLPLP